MRWPLVLALVLAFTSSASARATTTTFSLSIGVNTPPPGDPTLSQLHYADDDAARFFDLLSRLSQAAELLTTFDQDSARKYETLSAHATAPTEHAIGLAFAELSAKVKRSAAAGERPVVFVTYSGHGTLHAGHEPALALSDAILTRSRLHALLETLRPAQVHLIVDACHAGSIVGARGAFDRELETERVTLDEDTLSRLWWDEQKLGHVGLVLASGAALTHEWSEVEAGLFSHEVLSGLVGGADVNGDRRVQYSELWAFVSAANHRVREARARPEIVVRPPQNDFATTLFPLGDLKRSRVLRGDFSRFGHFFIELVGGSRVLDAHFASDPNASLTLPKDKDAYVVVGDREALISRNDGQIIEAKNLAFSSRRHSARGAIADALREGLFENAFGRSYYSGFVDSQKVAPVSFEPTPNVAATDTERSFWRSKPVRITAWTLTGSAALAAAISGSIALVAKHDFEDNELERASEGFDRRYRRSANGALISAGATLLFGATATWLEVRSRRAVQLDLTLTGLNVRGQF